MKNSITLNADTLLDEMMWQATRYCIGRHSYVSSYAEDYWQIIRKNFGKFNYNRLKFFARDIRAEISNTIGYYSNIKIKNADNDRIIYDAYTLLVEYFKRYSNISSIQDFIVDCVSGKVTHDGPYLGLRSFNPSEWENDLIPWIRLANCIDRQYEITCEKGGKIKKVICIQDPDGTYTCVDRWNAHIVMDNIKTINILNYDRLIATDKGSR